MFFEVFCDIVQYFIGHKEEFYTLSVYICMQAGKQFHGPLELNSQPNLIAVMSTCHDGIIHVFTIPGSLTSITRNSGISPSTGSRIIVYSGSVALLVYTSHLWMNAHVIYMYVVLHRLQIAPSPGSTFISPILQEKLRRAWARDNRGYRLQTIFTWTLHHLHDLMPLSY